MKINIKCKDVFLIIDVVLMYIGEFGELFCFEIGFVCFMY